MDGSKVLWNISPFFKAYQVLNPWGDFLKPSVLCNVFIALSELQTEGWILWIVHPFSLMKEHKFDFYDESKTSDIDCMRASLMQ